MTTTTRPDRRRTCEAGSFVVWWLIGLAGVGLLMFALVADGSRAVAAVADASDIAQVAARTAARQVDPSTGHLDIVRAEETAHAELQAAGMTGHVDVSGPTIVVSVTHTIELPLLALVGRGQHTVTASRTAEIITDPTGAP